MIDDLVCNKRNPEGQSLFISILKCLWTYSKFFLGGGTKGGKHELIHNKLLCYLNNLYIYPWFSEVSVAFPPPSFTDYSSCMFFKESVSKANKAVWPQLYCASTDQAIGSHQKWWQHFCSWRIGLSLSLLHFNRRCSFSHNCCIAPVCQYFEKLLLYDLAHFWFVSSTFSSSSQKCQRKNCFFNRSWNFTEKINEILRELSQ